MAIGICIGEVTGGLQVLSWALKLSTRECKQLDGGRHRKRLGTQRGGTVTTQVFQSHSALSDEAGLEQSHTTGRWQSQPQGYFSTGLCSPISDLCDAAGLASGRSSRTEHNRDECDTFHYRSRKINVLSTGCGRLACSHLM